MIAPNQNRCLHLETKLLITLCTLPVLVAAGEQDSDCPHTEEVMVPGTSSADSQAESLSLCLIKMSDVHTQSAE